MSVEHQRPSPVAGYGRVRSRGRRIVYGYRDIIRAVGKTVEPCVVFCPASSTPLLLRREKLSGAPAARGAIRGGLLQALFIAHVTDINAKAGKTHQHDAESGNRCYQSLTRLFVACPHLG